MCGSKIGQRRFPVRFQKSTKFSKNFKNFKNRVQFLDALQVTGKAVVESLELLLLVGAAVDEIGSNSVGHGLQIAAGDAGRLCAFMRSL